MSRAIIQALSHLLLPATMQFEQALHYPQQAQERVKRQVLKRLSKTAYGATLGIDAQMEWNRIPIVEYGDLEPWIQQQRQQPRASILTPERIHFWERTSGSTGAAKWIPYTTSLLGSFSAMFCVWVYDLIRHGPPLRTGKTYLCISPQIGTGEAGIDDSCYLNGYLRWLVDMFLVRVSGCFPTAEEFRWALALALLNAEDLEILSLWSPSFLTVQLEFIQAHQQQLQLALGDRISQHRWQLLSQPKISWTQLWPELKLISCWDRMHAADQAHILHHYFPGVLIQGKGLLATEAPMTIPLLPSGGFVPVLNQVVLEFLSPQDQVRKLTEVETGGTYELVISQLGGLSRYRIGDRVRVSHWYRNTPCLEFLGRGDRVSDFVGEKLTEAFVARILANLRVTEWGVCCLVPFIAHPPYYCLLLENSPETSETIATKLEEALQTGIHYQRARSLGQLGRAQVIIDKQVPLWLQQQGRIGDCKHSLLKVKPLSSSVNSPNS
ncbi:MAG: GH3 auxin-responsive promoter family protein [Desmonostoc geniculatum HA4340-LM1]|nr:GH3 auxin-responsive promoter family protein [Desmonostoc geniculatum HA4340-LM1]